MKGKAMLGMKKIFPRSAALVLGAGLLLGTGSAVAESVVATVNGADITEQQLTAFMRDSANSGATLSREDALQELISRTVVLQDAAALKLEERADIKQQLALLRETVLLQAALNEALKANPITEAELRAVYDERIGAVQAPTEYKARHILLETEDDAKAVIAELDGGADFATLAKERSTGPSGPAGGDLDWVTPDGLVPPFAQAMVALEKGKHSTTPVQTQFGWHVILVEDSRSMAPPAFEQVKPQIAELLKQQRIGAYISALQQQAQIEIK